MVYKDDQYTFQQLLDKDNNVTIHHQNLQKLLKCTNYKIIFPLKFMKEIFQEQNPSCSLTTEKYGKLSNSLLGNGIAQL